MMSGSERGSNFQEGYQSASNQLFNQNGYTSHGTGNMNSDNESARLSNA